MRIDTEEFPKPPASISDLLTDLRSAPSELVALMTLAKFLHMVEIGRRMHIIPRALLVGFVLGYVVARLIP